MHPYSWPWRGAGYMTAANNLYQATMTGVQANAIATGQAPPAQQVRSLARRMSAVC